MEVHAIVFLTIDDETQSEIFPATEVTCNVARTPYRSTYKRIIAFASRNTNLIRDR